MNLKNTLNRLKSIKIDKVLLIALLLGLIFNLYGINWGRYETWHPDEMVYKDLFDDLPFHPGDFEKPPFHTYFNFFLSLGPLSLIGDVLRIPWDNRSAIKLIWSNLLTAFLFLGSIALVFQITKRFFGLFAARIVAIVFATSAGFIAFSHFLTADIPVTFWMLVAFYFVQNILLWGRPSDYRWAGFFTGIATATKYNGLAIGLAIVVAHVLSFKANSWKTLILSKNLFLGLGMVVVGFLAGNPYALLDYPTFISDFKLNYTVTPAYGGETGTSYLEFFTDFRQIIGMPALIVFTLGFLFSFYILFKSKENPIHKKAILVLLAVFLLYYYKFGSFLRLPDRFVLPVVPLWLIMSGAFWEKLKPYKVLVSGILVIILSYNLVCDFYVGKRFVEDPRMLAQEWVKQNIPNGSVMESSGYTPEWNAIPGVDLQDIQMPFIHGRVKLYEKQFKDQPWIVEKLRGEDTEDEQWYSLEQLKARNPQYVAINSRYYNRFVEKQYGELYPSLKSFFNDLLSGRYPYKIVFDRESPIPPGWIYPKKIDFLHNRMVIFVRDDLVTPSGKS